MLKFSIENQTESIQPDRGESESLHPFFWHTYSTLVSSTFLCVKLVKS